MQEEGKLRSGRGRISLCAYDTTDEDRAELERRGFSYLGTRGSVVYFSQPGTHRKDPIYNSRKRHEYPEQGVTIIIGRNDCFCSSYHRDKDPDGAWNWSQVGFDGVFSRPRPERPPLTDEERVAYEARREEEWQRAVAARKMLEEQAATGDASAVVCLKMLNLRDEINKMVLDTLINAHKCQEKFLKEHDKNKE